MDTPKAIEVLKKVVTDSPNTVIDPDWEQYLAEDDPNGILPALLKVSKMKNYEELLLKYEGYTVEELLSEVS